MQHMHSCNMNFHILLEYIIYQRFDVNKFTLFVKIYWLLGGDNFKLRGYLEPRFVLPPGGGGGWRG